MDKSIETLTKKAPVDATPVTRKAHKTAKTLASWRADRNNLKQQQLTARQSRSPFGELAR